MNGGMIGTIVALVVLLASYLFGRKAGKDATTTRISGEITIAKQRQAQAEAEADMLKDVTPLVAETVKEQAKAGAEYEQTQAEIAKASRASDMDAMKAIAQRLAEKALSMGAKEAGK